MPAPPLSRAGGDGRQAALVELVHLGRGNFFRAHQAWYTEHAGDAGDWGYAVFAGRGADLAGGLHAQDGLYTLLERGSQRDTAEIIASLSEVGPRAFSAPARRSARTARRSQAGRHTSQRAGRDLRRHATKPRPATRRSDPDHRHGRGRRRGGSAVTYPVPAEGDPQPSQDGPVQAPEGTQPLVTIAALYGAGGSVIGPQVAARLGVAFMGRDIPEMAARRSGEPLDAVDAVAEGPHPGANRLTARLARAPIIGAAATRASAEPLEATERRLRSCIEAFLADAATRGGVLLGHGGMVVLRSVPQALHVLLRGPQHERVRQAMALHHVDRSVAEKRQQVEDRARIGYVRRAYGADGLDPCWYHLILDSTAIDLDDCVEQVVAAARARHPRPSPPI